MELFSRRRDEGLYLPNCQSNLVIALHVLSLLLCNFVNTTSTTYLRAYTSLISHWLLNSLMCQTQSKNAKCLFSCFIEEAAEGQKRSINFPNKKKCFLGVKCSDVFLGTKKQVKLFFFLLNQLERTVVGEMFFGCSVFL